MSGLFTINTFTHTFFSGLFWPYSFYLFKVKINYEELWWEIRNYVTTQNDYVIVDRQKHLISVLDIPKNQSFFSCILFDVEILLVNISFCFVYILLTLCKYCLRFYTSTCESKLNVCWSQQHQNQEPMAVLPC